MKKYTVAIIIVVTVAICLGCKRDETVVPLRGNIIGFVKLYDEGGTSLTDMSGVKVTSSEGQVASTDASGRFEFDNIEVGNYIFTFEKDGFSSIKRYNFRFAGGNKPGVISNVSLIQLPAIQLQDLKAETFSYLVVNVTGKISPVDHYYLTFFFSTASSVSNSNYDYTTSYSFCCQTGATSIQSIMNLPSTNYASGQHVYMAVYASSWANQSGSYSYYDYALQKYINNAVTKLGNTVELVLK